MLFFGLIASALALTATAAPPQALGARQDPSQGTPTAISNITPFQDPARWSEATYCAPSVGSVVNTATVLWAAGDGRDIPHAFVAYSASKNTIVVAHQGTNTSSILSIENDIEAEAVDPNSQLSGCVPSGSKIHSGFQDTWSHTADAVLNAITAAKQSHPTATVLVTGHSLGAAIGVLDATYLGCHGIAHKTIVFGQPRTGNYVFSQAQSLQHVVNGHDPVPHLPPNSNSYWHSPGEVWINPANSNSLVACPGSENVNCAWSVKFYDYETSDHTGTYAGVRIGGIGTC